MLSSKKFFVPFVKSNASCKNIDDILKLYPEKYVTKIKRDFFMIFMFRLFCLELKILQDFSLFY